MLPPISPRASKCCAPQRSDDTLARLLPIVSHVGSLPRAPWRPHSMAMPLAAHRFTVDEYHRMGQAGVFPEDHRVELIDGQVVEMTPIGDRHAACVRRL